MAQYLILIYEDESAWADGGQELADRMLKEHRAFGEANAAALRGGNALHPTSTATSVRTDAVGTVTVTDGAFAETKEALGGFYLIEADGLDEAIAVARQVPAPFGGVEVRPVRVLD
ncbi:YciI family protein [Kitasatospora sp. NPDC088346]|uniref:YciI family protein n=1 Tax=Kitasatospora sp. NPDC088346 TaxID=3364073 RepID=UPI003826E127